MSGFSFFLSPDKAYEYLKAKKPKLSFHYDEVLKEAHQKAFTVAKVTKLDLLSDIQDSLVRSMKEGVKFDDWKEQIEPTLKKKGWFSKTEVVNQDTGEVKTIDVNSSRLKTIYDVNMRTAYAKGRYESQMSSIGEYFYYGAILDDGTRTEHRALHGTVLHKSDPFWDQNYAPNGYRCRCKIRVYTKKQLERKGLKPTTTRPPNVFDKDWGYNPGKVDNIQAVYKQKIEALTCKDQNAKSKDVGCGFIDLVKQDSVVSQSDFKKWFKYENKSSFVIASLHPKYKKILGVKSSEVPITKKVLQKQKKNHPEIKDYEYLAINSMINKSELVIKKGSDILVHIKDILEVQYFCVIQANTKREKAFIASFRRTRSEDIKREMKNGEVVWDKR
jgi:SPP1 gp7 family putative phage head morphogenesis protein